MTRQKAISGTIFCIAVVFLFLIPIDNHPHWFLSLMATKVIAAALFFMAVRIHPITNGDEE